MGALLFRNGFAHADNAITKRCAKMHMAAPVKAARQQTTLSVTLRNLPVIASGTYTTGTGTFRNLLPELTPAHTGTLRNLPEPASGTYTPEPSGTFRNLLSGIYTSTHRNPPEPSGTCPRNLHQHTPELSGTFRNCLQESTPELSRAYASTHGNFPTPSGTHTGTLRSLSGLKTPLAYAVVEKQILTSLWPRYIPMFVLLLLIPISCLLLQVQGVLCRQGPRHVQASHRRLCAMDEGDHVFVQRHHDGVAVMVSASPVTPLPRVVLTTQLCFPHLTKDFFLGRKIVCQYVYNHVFLGYRIFQILFRVPDRFPVSFRNFLTVDHQLLFVYFQHGPNFIGAWGGHRTLHSWWIPFRGRARWHGGGAQYRSFCFSRKPSFFRRKGKPKRPMKSTGPKLS